MGASCFFSNAVCRQRYHSAQVSCSQDFFVSEGKCLRVRFQAADSRLPSPAATLSQPCGRSFSPRRWFHYVRIWLEIASRRRSLL
jgi:hypothetical protein